ncbi:hypothetical protein IT411_03060 [Candidatus Peregrinibacteria bacterium]|nr:hypothetical protein [Candidatus Peregrinibacteria bacterium]
MKKILITLLLTLQFLALAPVTLAAVDCASLNNQAEAAKSGGALAGKIVVITEEPLGTADGNTTKRCARKTECTYQTGNKPSGEGDPNAKPVPGDPGEVAAQKRSCKVSYEEIGSCTGTNSAEIEKTLSDSSNQSPFTICEIVQVYVTEGGTNLLYYYIGQIYKYMAWLGGFIAVFILIIAGLMRTTAGDNAEQITKANGLITKCISGLILLFLSAIILYAINPNFFVI